MHVLCVDRIIVNGQMEELLGGGRDYGTL